MRYCPSTAFKILESMYLHLEHEMPGVHRGTGVEPREPKVIMPEGRIRPDVLFDVPRSSEVRLYLEMTHGSSWVGEMHTEAISLLDHQSY